MKPGLYTLYIFLLCSVAARAQETDEAPSNELSKPDRLYAFNIGIGSMNGFIGFHGGFQYEQCLTRNGSLSFIAPLILSYGGTTTTGELKGGDPPRTAVSNFFVAPGIAYYPKGNTGTAYIGLGVLAALGLSNRKDIYPDAHGFNQQTARNKGFFAAVLGAFHINFERPAGFFGIFISGGPILSQAKPAIPTLKTGKGYFQFGLRFGGD